jgi:hypothetical protein
MNYEENLLRNVTLAAIRSETTQAHLHGATPGNRVSKKSDLKLFSELFPPPTCWRRGIVVIASASTPEDCVFESRHRVR